MTAVFEKDLEDLKKLLVAMGCLVEDIVQTSIAALTDRRDELIKEVMAQDKGIDAMENSIDNACFKMLAIHQPVADDLRFIFMAHGINNELERIGDHAKSLARATHELSRFPAMPVAAEFNRCADLAFDMLHKSLDALVHRDKRGASSVRDRDADLDEACSTAWSAITAAMKERADLVEPGIQALHVCRNLERIGDLACNIAKDLIFIIEGRFVRHGGAMRLSDEAEPQR